MSYSAEDSDYFLMANNTFSVSSSSESWAAGRQAMSQSAETNEFRRARWSRENTDPKKMWVRWKERKEDGAGGGGLMVACNRRIKKKEPSKCHGLAVLYYNLDHSTDSPFVRPGSQPEKQT